MSASVIKARTISTVDNRIQMTNGRCARPFTVSSSWTQLRLAFRYAFTDLGGTASSTPQFAFGFCSGGTNIYKASTTDHFVGWKTTTTSWTRDTNWSIYTSGGTITYQPFKRIGTTDTNGSGTQVGYGITYAVATIRNVMFCDLIKGSPNYTLRLFGRNTFTSADIPEPHFTNQAPLITNALGQHGLFTDRTLAVDEATNGTLNHVNFYWDRTDFSVEICDVQVLVLA